MCPNAQLSKIILVTQTGVNIFLLEENFIHNVLETRLKPKVFLRHFLYISEIHNKMQTLFKRN